MAYSNWGAFVHKDSVRREDREDVAVFNDEEKEFSSGARVIANIIRNRGRYPDGEVPAWERSYHAVLGDGPVRLVGYKSHAMLFAADQDGTVAEIDLAPYLQESYSDDDGAVYSGVYQAYVFTATGFNGNMVDLTLIEPDGADWQSRCGYLYGAGHLDYDVVAHAPES